jgi:hypothetical protein
MVWPVEVFQPQESNLQLDFFSNIHENHSSTVPNFIEIGPMAWISIADKQTHIDLHIF